MRSLLLAVLSASTGCAQFPQYFAEFAAPGDGSRLYFSNTLPLQGSSEPVQGRIFSVDASGVHTVADVQASAPASFFTNYFALSRPELSRDGTILAYTGQRSCSGSTICEANPNPTQTTVTGLPGGNVTAIGSGRLSGNGRYLLLTGPFPTASSTILDLQTGQSQTLPISLGPDGAGRVAADDGTVVYCEGSLVIAKGTTLQSISFPSVYADQAVIDSGAHTIVYVQWDYVTNLHSIHTYSIDHQMDATLFSQGDSTSPFVSADGARAMFISTASGSPQIWILNTDATGPHQVTSDAAGVLSAAMSDDGTAVWYLSNSGRVIQVDLNSGVAQERIGRTPNWKTNMPAMAPGTAWTLEGSGFSDGVFSAASYPLPQALGGVTVSIGGMNAPIWSVEPTRIVVQVPWEVPAANFAAASVSVVINTAYSSPFVARLSGQAAAWTGFGVFLQDATDFYVLAVHQDWSARVTPSNPAHPNEIVHFYGLDFGPVDSHPPTGMPAPVDRLSRTIAPITCWAWGADNATKLTVPVLFSGLAPGIPGYYQLDVQLPSSNLRPDTQLSCNGSGYDDDFNGYVAVLQ